jgi:hypothetical protein
MAAALNKHAAVYLRIIGLEESMWWPFPTSSAGEMIVLGQRVLNRGNPRFGAV